MNCSKCDNPLEEGINLCPHCGKEYIICEKCGRHNEMNSEVCIYCVNSQSKDTVSETTVLKEKFLNIIEIIEKKRKPIVITSIAVFILVVSITLLTNIILPSGNKGLYNLFYVKGSTLYRRNINSKKANEFATDYEYPGQYNAPAKLSADGKRFFYPQGKEKGFELKYSTLDMWDETGSIDTDVYTYMINKDGTVVYYTKGADKTLFRFDIKTKTRTRFDNMVKEYFIDPAGNKLIYVQSDVIYYWSNNGNKKIIAIDAYVTYVSEDLSKLYFTRSNMLHLVRDGGEAIRITEYGLLKENVLIYDTEEMYYLNDRYDGYIIYYFNGENKTLVSKQVNRIVASSTNAPVIVFEKDSKLYLAVKENIKQLDIDINNTIAIDNSASKIYYRTNSGDLNSYDIAKDEYNAFDTDVLCFSFLKDSDKCIYTKFGSESMQTDLYIDKKKTDTNVFLTGFAVSFAQSHLISDSKGNVLYTKIVMNNENDIKELWLYNGRKSVKVTDNYNDFYYIDSEAIVYMTYNKDSSFSLYLFDGRRSKLIAKEVNAFIPIVREHYRLQSESLYSILGMSGYDVTDLVYSFYQPK